LEYTGAAYIFTRTGTTWLQQAYLKASNTQSLDNFGWAISLNDDGSTLAVGTAEEDSAAVGIGGDETNNTSNASGAVYVFSRSGDVWSQQAYVKASNAGANDRFGSQLSFSSDGNTLAVGVPNEDSTTMGINGNEFDNFASDSGAVYVFTRAGTAWSQQAYVKSSNTEAGDAFGWSVSLNAAGNILAVSARYEQSSSLGVNGDETNNTTNGSGAVYVFQRTNLVWSQLSYVKAPSTDANDNFGTSVSLSSDANTLAVGSSGEDSAATDIGGSQSDNTATDSGATFLF